MVNMRVSRSGSSQGPDVQFAIAGRVQLSRLDVQDQTVSGAVKFQVMIRPRRPFVLRWFRKRVDLPESEEAVGAAAADQPVAFGVEQQMIDNPVLLLRPGNQTRL